MNVARTVFNPVKAKFSYNNLWFQPNYRHEVNILSDILLRGSSKSLHISGFKTISWETMVCLNEGL